MTGHIFLTFLKRRCSSDSKHAHFVSFLSVMIACINKKNLVTIYSYKKTLSIYYFTLKSGS